MATSFFTTTLHANLSSPFPFPPHSSALERLQSCFVTRFGRSTGFKLCQSKINSAVKRRRRSNNRSELNAVDDDKDTGVVEDKARAALAQLDSQLSALAEKQVSEKRNPEYLVIMSILQARLEDYNI